MKHPSSSTYFYGNVTDNCYKKCISQSHLPVKLERDKNRNSKYGHGRKVEFETFATRYHFKKIQTITK